MNVDKYQNGFVIAHYEMSIVISLPEKMLIADQNIPSQRLNTLIQLMTVDCYRQTWTVLHVNFKMRPAVYLHHI